MRGEILRLAARGADHIDVILSFGIGLEHNAFTVGRPAGRACPRRMKVSWTALDPSGSAIQISHAPERSDTKAMRRPSGESCGVESLLVEEIDNRRRGGRPARSRNLDTPDIGVLETANVDQTRRPDWKRETTGMCRPRPRKAVAPACFFPGTTSLQRLPLAEKRISLLPGVHVG